MADIHGAVIDSVIGNLLEAKKQLDGTIMGASAAHSLIDESLESLGYKKEELQERYKDGVYVLTHHQYTAMVNATFIHDGLTLNTMVDMEGNDWKTWALSHGVFDPECRFCYILPFLKEAQ